VPTRERRNWDVSVGEVGNGQVSRYYRQSIPRTSGRRLIERKADSCNCRAPQPLRYGLVGSVRRLRARVLPGSPARNRIFAGVFT